MLIMLHSSLNKECELRNLNLNYYKNIECKRNSEQLVIIQSFRAGLIECEVLSGNFGFY